MSSGSCDGDRFQMVWANLDEETRHKIREKAAWEAMSISAVIREWWPRIWRKIKDDGNRQTDDIGTRCELPSVRKLRTSG